MGAPAPLEFIFPDQLHVPPTFVAHACMRLAGRHPLTSPMAMMFWHLDNGVSAAPPLRNPRWRQLFVTKAPRARH